MTEQQEKAIRLGEARQRGRELKEQIATLKNQMTQFADAWLSLAGMLKPINIDNNTFRIDDGGIHVLRSVLNERLKFGQSPTTQEIATVSLGYFDGKVLKEKLNDLEQKKRVLADIKKQCEEMGDPL